MVVMLIREIKANIVYSKNLYKREEEDYYIYISSSEKIESFTGDKNSFLGEGGLK